MICLICRQAEVVEGFTALSFQRGEFNLQMNKVPALICPSCGEAYVEEDIAVRLFQRVENVAKAGILEDLIDF